MDSLPLILSIFYGIIGFIYFEYGRKNNLIYFMLSGIALIVIPYLLEQASTLLICGVTCLVMPFALPR